MQSLVTRSAAASMCAVTGVQHRERFTPSLKASGSRAFDKHAHKRPSMASIAIYKKIKSLKAPHEAERQRLEKEIRRLQRLAPQSSQELQKLLICQRKLEHLKTEVIPSCALKPILELIISDPELKQFEVAGVALHPDLIRIEAFMDIGETIQHVVSSQKLWGASKVLEIVKALLIQFTPAPNQVCQFEKVESAMRNAVFSSIWTRERDPDWSECDTCMRILRTRFRMMDLRTERAAKVIQRACKIRLLQKRRAARIVRERYLRYRFRPGGPLAQENVRRLYEAAQE